jgi:hypothetical protein
MSYAGDIGAVIGLTADALVLGETTKLLKNNTKIIKIKKKKKKMKIYKYI